MSRHRRLEDITVDNSGSFPSVGVSITAEDFVEELDTLGIVTALDYTGSWGTGKQHDESVLDALTEFEASLKKLH